MMYIRGEIAIFATATNKPLPYVTLCHAIVPPNPVSLGVHVMPSGDVRTWVEVPATETNRPLPYARPFLVPCAVWRVQFMPFGDVITFRPTLSC